MWLLENLKRSCQPCVFGNTRTRQPSHVGHGPQLRPPLLGLSLEQCTMETEAVPSVGNSWGPFGLQPPASNRATLACDSLSGAAGLWGARISRVCGDHLPGDLMPRAQWAVGGARGGGPRGGRFCPDAWVPCLLLRVSGLSCPVIPVLVILCH